MQYAIKLYDPSYKYYYCEFLLLNNSQRKTPVNNLDFVVKTKINIISRARWSRGMILA